MTWSSASTRSRSPVSISGPSRCWCPAQARSCGTGGLGGLDELVTHHTPLVGVLGIPDSRVKPIQGEGEGGWVTQPARHRHGRLAERGDAFGQAAVAQRAGEPGKQLDA